MTACRSPRWWLATCLPLALTGCGYGPSPDDSGTTTTEQVLEEVVLFITSRSSDFDLAAVPISGGVAFLLTDQSQWDLDPTCSPTGLIAYQRLDVDSGQSEIRILAPDWNGDVPVGEPRGRERVIKGPSFSSGPTWSPSGDSVAFVGGDNGASSIFIAESGTTEASRLFSYPGPLWELAWSPDGDSIAVSAGLPDQRQILTIDVTSGEQSELTAPGQGGYSLSWSPDSSQLAFAADGEVYRLDVQTLEIDAVASHPDDDGFPTFTPDGHAIVFVSNRDTDPRDYDLYRVRLPDGEPELLYDDDAGISWPTFSRSGKLLAFVSGLSFGPDPNLEQEIFVLDMESGEAASLDQTGDQPVWCARPRSRRVDGP